MLSKSLKWELGLVQYNAKFTISRFECILNWVREIEILPRLTTISTKRQVKKGFILFFLPKFFCIFDFLSNMFSKNDEKHLLIYHEHTSPKKSIS